MDTTLIIMAAGIGSRFGGGIKQLEPVGPNGEIIMDYSIHDALEAGFDRIIFVIRHDLEEDFKEVIGNRIEKIAPVTYAFQELSDVPEGFSVPADRKKPWGTGQAILSIRGLVEEPFLVINADDYYGKEVFRKIHTYMVEQMDVNAPVYDICMGGFILANTLSENGGVTRGVCEVGEGEILKRVTETYNIQKTADGMTATDKEGNPVSVQENQHVSMNMWGLTPEFVETLEKGFKEFFAVKATPNPFLINILREYGCGCDCSSYTELMLSEALGAVGKDIMFSSNATPAEEFVYADKLGAIINLDDFTHIEFLENAIGHIPEMISCRYNPGGLFKISNDIMDNPGDAKYGMTTEQLFEAFKILKAKGAKEFGLHAFLASNTVTNEYYPMLAKILFEVAVKLQKETGAHIKFINLSGGVGIPYRPDQEPNDIRAIGEGVRKVYEEVLVQAGMGDVAIYTELGRYMMGPYGCIVTKAVHEKHTYKEYIGCDACAVNLMRPAMYGAYHHITVMGKEDAPCDHKYDITGSLCENNDKFAVDRMLPKIDIGDLLVIHDTGAHGFAMGYNYNGKLKSAEILLQEDGTPKLIRRAETPEDYFATFDCFEIGQKLK